MFRFPDSIRERVAQIVNMMEWANAQQSDLADQTGLYGHLSLALTDIIRHYTSPAVVLWLANNLDGYNFGGNQTWLDDVEIAISCAMAEIEADEISGDDLDAAADFYDRLTADQTRDVVNCDGIAIPADGEDNPFADPVICGCDDGHCETCNPECSQRVRMAEVERKLNRLLDLVMNNGVVLEYSDNESDE